MQFVVTNGIVVLPDHAVSGEVWVRDGLIDKVCSPRADEWPSDALIIDANGGYIAPGLIDLHIHGSGGFDMMQGDRDTLIKLAKYLAGTGTTAWLGTTMTAPPTLLSQVAQACRELEITDGSQFLGLHLEGPFINPEKKGAQSADAIRAFDFSELMKLQEAAGGCIKRITVAPELLSLDDLERIQSLGILTSIGHTLADYDTVRQAAQKGCCLATHIFNGMGPLDHHCPGTVGAVLDLPKFAAEIIADGVHLHPAIIRMIVKVKGPKQVVLITDALPPSGLPVGEYPEYGVKIAQDAVYLQNGVLSGSKLTMATAVKNAVMRVGLDLVAAFRMATLTPAEIIGVADTKGSIQLGKDADLVVLSRDFEPRFTLVSGRLVFQAS